MAKHRVNVRWQHTQGDFRAGTYSREHRWTFDGGAVVPASPSPYVIRQPLSNPAFVDPEEAFIASIASCHMLTFLHLAQQRGFVVTSYEDDAVGVLTKNERRVSWVSSVVLSPRVLYEGHVPSAKELATLHDDSHRECFIANSVKTEITVRASELEPE
jgi:organic hydroperoxide reductase OsmC/OhrA